MYWYEDGIRQGIYVDEKNIKDTQFEGVERGREIYDPASNAWHRLDALYEGTVARSQEVWMPYVFQEEEPGSTNGKWVRYDKYGLMVKGWYSNENGSYYYDSISSAMLYQNDQISGTDIYNRSAYKCRQTMWNSTHLCI